MKEILHLREECKVPLTYLRKRAEQRLDELVNYWWATMKEGHFYPENVVAMWINPCSNQSAIFGTTNVKLISYHLRANSSTFWISWHRNQKRRLRSCECFTVSKLSSIQSKVCLRSQPGLPWFGISNEAAQPSLHQSSRCLFGAICAGNRHIPCVMNVIFLVIIGDRFKPKHHYDLAS